MGATFQGIRTRAGSELEVSRGKEKWAVAHRSDAYPAELLTGLLTLCRAEVYFYARIILTRPTESIVTKRM